MAKVYRNDFSSVNSDFLNCNATQENLFNLIQGLENYFSGKSRILRMASDIDTDNLSEHNYQQGSPLVSDECTRQR